MGKKFLAMLLALLLLFSISKSAALGNNNNYKHVSDQHSLLAFKNAASFDPDNSLGNWSPNVSFCKWIGVTCSTHMRRVVGLNLSGMDLEGAISPLVGNLSALQTLDLSDNRLRGSIPVELTQLSHLQVLRLGANYITDADAVSISANSRYEGELQIGSITHHITHHTRRRLCDVSKGEAIKTLSNFAVSKLGSIDIWMNNAGTNKAFRPLSQFTDEDINQDFAE